VVAATKEPWARWRRSWPDRRLQSDGSSALDHKSEIEVARRIGSGGELILDLGVVDFGVGVEIARTVEPPGAKLCVAWSEWSRTQHRAACGGR